MKISQILTFLSLPLILLLPGLKLSGQSKSEIIKSIKKEFVLINSDSNYKKIKLENEDFLENTPDGGCELTGYFKDGQIKKCREWIGVSNGNNVTEFYFNDGYLIFVYKRFNAFVYDEQKGEMDHTKTKINFEGRYYFSKNKLIDKLINGKSQVDEENNDPEKFFLEEARSDLKLLEKKK